MESTLWEENINVGQAPLLLDLRLPRPWQREGLLKSQVLGVMKKNADVAL